MVIFVRDSSGISPFAVIATLPRQTSNGPVMANFQSFRNPHVARHGARPLRGRQSHLARIVLPSRSRNPDFLIPCALQVLEIVQVEGINDGSVHLPSRKQVHVVIDTFPIFSLLCDRRLAGSMG